MTLLADPTNMLTHWGECPAVEDGLFGAGSPLVFRGTDVPVARLFSILKRNGTIRDFMYWYGVTVNEDDVRTVLGFLAAEAYRPSHDIQAIILRRLVTELQSGDASRNHDWLSQPHFDRLKQWCSTQTTERVTDWSDCPQTNRFPGKVSGKLVFYDSRMPVGHLFGVLRDDFSVSVFLDWFHEGSGLLEHDVVPILEFLENDLLYDSTAYRVDSRGKPTPLGNGKTDTGSTGGWSTGAASLVR